MMTFDYEMFMKKSGSIEKCLIEPTDKLIEIFNNYSIKATFFIDILYYLRLLENKQTAEQSKIIKDQLQRLVSNGHRIELHLHPHWLDAVYENGEWSFLSYDNYRLHNLSEEKIVELFVSGTQIINSIAQEVTSSYAVIAFRAGGWCLQPFNKLREGFIKSGIKIDTTVAMGLERIGSDIQFYDFINAPDCEIYRFSEDPLVIDKAGGFIEIPITTFKNELKDKITRRIMRINKLYKDEKYFSAIGDGTGLGLGDLYSKDQLPGISSKIFKKFFSSSPGMFSIQNSIPELISASVLKHKNGLINFISHPKNLSKASFDSIEALAKGNLEFCEITEVMSLI